VAVVVFACVTLAVGAIEAYLAVDDASPLYLVAVVGAASLLGAPGGLAAAVGAFLVYDFLFTEPRLTFLVGSSREWLELLLLLFVALVVGRLTGLASDREVAARVRAREADALARVSRALATLPLAEALPVVVAELAAELDLERVWIEVDGPRARVAADTSGGAGRRSPGRVGTLARGASGRWIQARPPRAARAGIGAATATPGTMLRVRIERDDRTLGALCATTRDDRPPGAPTARLLGLAADVVGLALERDRLAAAELEAEVARRSEALKSRLVTSVSHDLRTPLAGIRAAAGTILDPDAPSDEVAARAAASTIDAEAVRLDRMIRGLLDLGRVESGALRARLEPFELSALVGSTLERSDPLLANRAVEVDVSPELPPVLVDDLLFDHVLANLLENVARHAPAPARVRIHADEADATVRLLVEDGGPGVAETRATRMFRSGDATGIGLAVVRALSEAMSIGVSAGRSSLGGLAVELRIPTAAHPPDEAAA
jgi:two-component system sensor histidine kinase KdpD